MDIQTDYETDTTLAVFRSNEAASQAVRQLELRGIRPESLRHVPLSTGRFQLADTSILEEAAGALRGAEIGIPVGAVLGLGLAVSVAGGTPTVLAGLAGAGAMAGALLGGLEGAVLRTHFDDDVASMLEVAPGDGSTLIVIATSSADGTTRHARKEQRDAGAIAFLDQATFDIATLM
jgi:hypothetical protein